MSEPLTMSKESERSFSRNAQFFGRLLIGDLLRTRNCSDLRLSSWYGDLTFSLRQAMLFETTTTIELPTWTIAMIDASLALAIVEVNMLLGSNNMWLINFTDRQL
jgi:hypothetical protein